MGFGDNESPAIRADFLPATLYHSSRFAMLFLTFVKWDVIKLSWSLENSPSEGLEIGSGALSTDYLFQPTQSDGRYTFTAQGCNKAVDGSTSFCSPVSKPYLAVAAHNTNSVKQFLKISGIDLQKDVSLRALIQHSANEISLRTLMVLGR
ncbi:MAG: hypothetical protein V7L00_23465 [Nostoc sp.]|uniref:hypothetical protein n=1 Tax=Nostoc sp. TaxID=1180 RepID=UPI002FFBDBE2